MKIDFIRNKQIPEGENTYENRIKSNDVYDYVLANLKFELSETNWIHIDKIFSEIWNSKIGLGGDIYLDEIEDEILLELKKQRILLPDNYVKTVVHMILDYIDKAGGIIE